MRSDWRRSQTLDSFRASSGAFLPAALAALLFFVLELEFPATSVDPVATDEDDDDDEASSSRDAGMD